MAGKSRRRFLLWSAAALAGGLFAVRFGVPRWVRPRPRRELSDAARELVRRAFEGIDRRRMIDGHVHVVGVGSGGSGCRVNPEMLSHLNPIKRFQYEVYREAIGFRSPETADRDYVDRLLALHRESNPEGKLLLLAFDEVVDEAGRPQADSTPFYTPNDYVLRLAAEHPDCLAAASVHPYRRDAVERLDAAYERGARAVKWLPNAMGIDPGSALCDPFYRRLAELDLPLISHAGEEYAVDSAAHQALGNPLLLRRALDAGVRVVVAHCASFGVHPDLDRAGRPTVASFDLFLRLAADPRYADRLYGDVSCIAQLNRTNRVLRELLAAEWLHPRLVNGSDYPIPALHVLFSMTKLRWAGLLDESAADALDELSRVNPLLFAFALKRSLRVERDGRELRLPARVFETAWLFDR